VFFPNKHSHFFQTNVLTFSKQTFSLFPKTFSLFPKTFSLFPNKHAHFSQTNILTFSKQTFSLFPMSEDERVETAGIVAAQEHRLQVGAAVRCTNILD
jgi:hypothetical protein